MIAMKINIVILHNPSYNIQTADVFKAHTPLVLPNCTEEQVLKVLCSTVPIISAYLLMDNRFFKVSGSINILKF